MPAVRGLCKLSVMQPGEDRCAKRARAAERSGTYREHISNSPLVATRWQTRSVRQTLWYRYASVGSVERPAGSAQPRPGVPASAADGDASGWWRAAGFARRSELCLQRAVIRDALAQADAAVLQPRLRRLRRNTVVWARLTARRVGSAPASPSMALIQSMSRRQCFWPGQVLAYDGALVEEALAVPEWTAPRLTPMQALTDESYIFLFYLRWRQVVRQAHMPAAQLPVFWVCMLGDGADRPDQHRAGAGVRRPRSAHARDVLGLDAAQHDTVHGRGVRPVLVQLDTAPGKHAILKHSTELRGRHVCLCGHLTPAQLKTQKSLKVECLRLCEARRRQLWRGERLFLQGTDVTKHLPGPRGPASPVCLYPGVSASRAPRDGRGRGRCRAVAAAEAKTAEAPTLGVAARWRGGRGGGGGGRGAGSSGSLHVGVEASHCLYLSSCFRAWDPEWEPVPMVILIGCQLRTASLTGLSICADRYVAVINSVDFAPEVHKLTYWRFELGVPPAGICKAPPLHNRRSLACACRWQVEVQWH